MNTYEIPFTQYLRPDGRRVEVIHQTDSEVTKKKADEIIDAGFRFECEHLMTGDASLTISSDEMDHAIRVVRSGPSVVAAIKDMVAEFDIEKAKERRDELES